MKISICITIIALAAIVMTTSLVNAQNAPVPPLINYQGVLTDSAGNRLSGTYQITFSIYDDSTDGTLLWTEVQESVKCSCGVFNVQLGSVQNIATGVFKYPNRWLGVKLEDDPEMTPRRRITSTGYAFHGGYAGLDYFCPPNDSVEIHFPHYAPFEIMMSELYAKSDNSAWMSGGENDDQLSYVGIDGSGNVVHGTASLVSIDTILTVSPGLVLRTKGDGSWNLVLESSVSNKYGRATVITPHDKPEYGD
jgi:hypothetical protein